METEDWYQTAVKKFKINEISYRKLGKKQTRIGCGGFGLIYKTKCESIGIVAIKEITITLEDDETCIKNFINELKIHSRVLHERIIRFHGISRNVTEGLYYLVLEYANQGNLREFLIEKKNNVEILFDWEERMHIATQIAEGLHYLHERSDIAHCNLHTKNILINNGNIKISDFGLSKNLNSTLSNNKFFGMIPFIDPQKFINGKKFVLDKKSDIYSLGMVLWEISSCRIPFAEEDQMYLTIKIGNGLREKPIKGTPIQYVQLYTDCWQLEPNSRPLFNQIILQIQSISYEPVFEDSDENSESVSINESKNFTSGYSNNLFSLTIPDDLTISSTNNAKYGTCKECNSQYTDHNWCHNCEAQKFKEDFSSWTSGNQDVDKIIQNSQFNATEYNNYFEWINFNRFEDLEYITEGGCNKIYTATWIDGIRELWDNTSQQWVRTNPVKIILRRSRDEDPLSAVKNLKLHLDFKVIRCYGVTNDPESGSYYMVLKYANGGNLHQYIRKNFPNSWFKRLLILQKIVEGLYSIHKKNYIHGDFHSGNILLQENDWNQKLEVYISDLDFCANLNIKSEQKAGIVPYVAPEIFKGDILSIKSDIYGLGMIMWELASGDIPFSEYEYNVDLIYKMVDGLRPRDIIGIPQCYHKLMQKCLDANPKNRPTTPELLIELCTFTTIPLSKQFKAADRIICDQPKLNEGKYISRSLSKLICKWESIQFPDPKNAIEKILYFNNEGLLDYNTRI